MALLTGEQSKAKLNAPQVETPPAIDTGFGAAGGGCPLCWRQRGDQTLLVFRKTGSSKVADDKRSLLSGLIFVGLCV